MMMIRTVDLDLYYNNDHTRYRRHYEKQHHTAISDATNTVITTTTAAILQRWNTTITMTGVRQHHPMMLSTKKHNNHYCSQCILVKEKRSNNHFYSQWQRRQLRILRRRLYITTDFDYLHLLMLLVTVVVVVGVVIPMASFHPYNNNNNYISTGIDMMISQHIPYFTVHAFTLSSHYPNKITIGGGGGCRLHSRYSDLKRFIVLLHNTPNHAIGIDSNKDITIDDSTNNNDVTGNVIMNLNNNTSDDERDDDDDDDYHIRFRGIGQLYSATTNTTMTDLPQSSSSSSSSSPPLTDTTTTTIAEVMENSSSIVLQRLQNAVVVVVGVGGVGSWTVEALGRSGIGTIILMDMDDICISNINRQLHALSNTIGSMKIDILYQRLQQINPHCIVHRIYDFISTDNIYDLFDTINANWGVPTTTFEQNDCIDNTTTGSTSKDDNMSIMTTKRVTAVLDCIDSAREKAALLAYCNHRMIPICTVGSTAGRTNPALVTFGDITHVHTSTMGHSRDRLLTTVRKELRQQYNFIPGRPYGRKSKPWLIPCVYSEEEVAVPEQPSPLTSVLMDTATTNSNNNNNAVPGSSSSFRQCDNGVLGTASFVTGTFGFVAASIIVQGIAQNQLHPPRGTSNNHNNNNKVKKEKAANEVSQVEQS